jgi:hypothetical protein
VGQYLVLYNGGVVMYKYEFYSEGRISAMRMRRKAFAIEASMPMREKQESNWSFCGTGLAGSTDIC